MLVLLFCVAWLLMHVNLTCVINLLVTFRHDFQVVDLLLTYLWMWYTSALLLLELLRTYHLSEIKMRVILIWLIFGALVLLSLSAVQENSHIQLTKDLSILCYRWGQSLLISPLNFCYVDQKISESAWKLFPNRLFFIKFPCS